MEKQDTTTNLFMQKVFRFINREDTKKQFQIFIMDPLLNHIMERVFPYIILTLILFTTLLVVVMLILGIIIFQLRKGIPAVSTVTAVM